MKGVPENWTAEVSKTGLLTMTVDLGKTNGETGSGNILIASTRGRFEIDTNNGPIQISGSVYKWKGQK